MADTTSRKELAEIQCSVCMNLDIACTDQNGRKRYRAPFMVDVGDIRDAAQNGCSGCSLIIQALNLINREEGSTDSGVLVRLEEPGKRLAVAYRDAQRKWMELFRLPGTEVDWFPTDSAQLVSGNTYSSTAHLQLARTWLQDCLSHHQTCHSLGSSNKHGPLLPKRVIDVTPLDDSGSVRLVQPTNQRAQYLCLSHCWGEHSIPARTTTLNLGNRINLIPWASLTKVFQDSIAFVRFLGQRYLWIDSLCIIQDDNDDWEDQAAQMASIYQNSYLTLAATKSKGGHEGLHNVENLYPTTTLVAEGPNAEQRSVMGRERLLHLYYFDQPNPTPKWLRYERLLSRSFPLIRRAWAFQERLLSPRVLHFGPAELLWECCETLTCECTHGILPSPDSFPKRQYSHALSNASPVQRSEAWRNVVDGYSRLKLTYESDRLPAIQGIASQLLGINSSKPLISGLWVDYLVRDLQWDSVDIPERDPSQQWRAPSWSWVSMDGGILYMLGALETFEHATVVDIQMQDNQPEGRLFLNAKSLTLCVPMLSGRIHDRVGQNDWFTFDNVERVDYDASFRPDWESAVKTGDVAYCLFLATTHFPHRTMDFGLIIRRTSDKSMEFERIGSMKVDHMSEKASEDTFDDISEDSSDNTPEDIPYNISSDTTDPSIVPPRKCTSLEDVFEGVEKVTVTLI